MKKLIPILFTILLLAACEKDPDLDKVNNDYVIYTQYDKTANFGIGNTFYIADSVLEITNNKEKATYLSSSIGDAIINAFVTNMTQRGYTRTESKTEATYGIQISFLSSTYYYVDEQYWWDSYPYYWTSSYWGPWYDGGWYYPYSFVYSYTNGSLIGEMVDLSTATYGSSSNNKLTVIWNCFITGLLTGNSNINETNTTQAINQAFQQSSYLKY